MSYEIGITQHLNQHPAGRQAPRRADERDGVRRRVRAAASLCFFRFWWRGLGSYRSLSASLRWAEETLNPFRTAVPFTGQTTQTLSGVSPKRDCGSKGVKRHARDSDGDAAIDFLRFSSVFWVDRSVLVALGRSSWWNKLASDSHGCSRSNRRGALCCGL